MNEIIIATKNRGKAKEYNQLFNEYGITVKSLLDLSEEIPDVEETGDTFKENARLKAEQISRLLEIPVLADDSGLVIDALDGRPGVYSARYAGEPTDDKKNYEKVLNELTEVPSQSRTARFVCVLALAIPQGETVFKEGFCEGIIAESPVGGNGFGYDPIFIPEGFEKTMAQLEDEEKNKISHRYHALMKMKTWLNVKLGKGESNE
ncbi:XTP/dITP diphosphatase [Pseudogracilibacillus auburnensis]|uniref:dITP/XTP pyrophosphatase n=1 Tax=Pseudogracilibacillus auburnensis TaxID=1494959 RepID=A0A2V3VYI0_9BACI|nr:XTP/dITP diphosphatase [Pseudogracilibacillus auburnensis]PXW81649.1 XTP/dITP diphosphohydrolase [Pseudogracilibacillus auburnensis]